MVIEENVLKKHLTTRPHSPQIGCEENNKFYFKISFDNAVCIFNIQKVSKTFLTTQGPRNE